MKNRVLTVAATTLLISACFTVFGQQNKKAAEARKEVIEAKKDLKEANAELREAKVDSAADFQTFKKDAEMKISENQTKITALKGQKADENKAIKEKYNKDVSVLQQKNNELKRKIKTADTTKTSGWTSFKREFNHDIDELGLAIKDIGVNNIN